jgi:hypothetical protein
MSRTVSSRLHRLERSRGPTNYALLTDAELHAAIAEKRAALAAYDAAVSPLPEHLRPAPDERELALDRQIRDLETRIAAEGVS